MTVSTCKAVYNLFITRKLVPSAYVEGGVYGVESGTTTIGPKGIQL